MINMKKRALILGAVLALSYCQGRHANVFDPTQGANYMTAQQYLSAPVNQGTYLPTRTQSYNYSFTQADYQRCSQEGLAAQQNQGQLTDFCAQLVMDLYNRNGYGQYYGSNYPSDLSLNFQQPGVTAGYNPYSFNVRNFMNTNPTWMNGYQNQWGGFRTQVPMGGTNGFCGNQGYYTNMQYSSPCGNVNYWYAVYNLQGNQAYNQMLTGNVGGLQQVYGPNGLYATKMPGLYTSVAGYYKGTLTRMNTTEERENVQTAVRTNWNNIKTNMGPIVLGKLANSGMNVFQSIIGGIVARVENRASNVVLNNSITTGMLQASTDWNYTMGDFSSNIMAPTATGNVVDMTVNEEARSCAADSYHYEINPEVSNGVSYRVECPNK